MEETKRWKEIGAIVSAIFLGIGVGTLFHYLGLSMGRTAYFFLLLLLFMLSLYSPKSALFLFFLTIPLNYIGAITEWKTIVRVQHIFSICFMLAVSYYLFVTEKKETLARRMATPIDIPLFLFFIIMTISIIQTVYIPNNPPINLNRIHNYPWIESIVKILILGVYIGLFYGIQAMLQTKEEIKKWLTRYMAIGSIIAVYGLVAFVTFVVAGYYISIDGYPAVVDLDNDLPRIKATEHEPFLFGFYLMTFIPVLLALAIMQVRRKTEFYKKKLLFWFLGITLFALFLSGSRSAILAFIFASGTLFLLNKEKQSLYEYIRSLFNYYKRYFEPIWSIVKVAIGRIVTSKKMIALSLLFLIITIFFVILHWEIVETKSLQLIREGILAPTIGTFNSNYGKYWSTKTRLIMIDYALDAFQEHPWIGVGYENYGFYTGNQRYLGLLEFNITWPEVNNYPLRVLVEQGIIGFVAFLFLVVVLFYSLFTARKKTDDHFLKALIEGYIATFVGFGIIFTFTSNIIKPYIWVTLAFAIAIVKVVNNLNNNNKDDKAVHGDNHSNYKSENF